MDATEVEEYQKIVKPLLSKVFNDSIFSIAESINYPLNDSIEASIFLYSHGDESYDMQAFWNILRDSILKLGDTFIYIVFTSEESWRTLTLEQNKDFELGHFVCQAIFSASGTWGLSQHFDGLAFLGGSQSFINNISKSFFQMDQQFFNFLTDWKKWGYVFDDTWLPEVLLKIYGEERSKELLKESEEMGVYYKSSDESQ